MGNKRIAALLLSAVMTAGLFSSVPSASAYAAPKTITRVEVKNAGKTLVLKKGIKFTLKPTVTGTGSKAVKYSSSNPKVVKVSKKGTIKAIKNGTAVITVKSAKNSSKKCKIHVIVGIPVQKITTDKSVTLKVGESKDITVTITPKKASLKTVTYTSSNDSIATVSSKGKITGVAAGTAQITITAIDGSHKKATCSVTIEKKGTDETDDKNQSDSDKSNTDNNTQNTPGDQTSTPSDQTNPSGETTSDDHHSNPTPSDTRLSYDGYNKVWEDDFNGDTLDENSWNVETHEPGWVNSELQAYTQSGNYTVSDGKLTIHPKKVKNADGTYSYTSARLNTKGKRDYTYGLFEVVAKVPSGKGFLPAFWLMPNDENLYGQWPRCGEIDAMEVMGQDTKTAYGTIHYGNPHKQNQGTYTLKSDDFSKDYHKFSCDWEPGKITWYIDGIKYFETSDWYSTTEGQGTVAYPAPFDQPFYMILNLAVGGSWVGYPTDDQDINSQSYSIDSVRVYQKKGGYDDSQVKAPEKKPVVIKTPDAKGNYISNGDFSSKEDLTDDKDWKFLTALEGEGTASIDNNEIKIETTKAGTADYSIQLVQPNIPAEQAGEYQLTFDAYADDNRTMKVDVSAPDRSYVRYLKDTDVNLTTQKQSYNYTYTMDKETDANSRLEFNLGNTNSTATVHISNVCLKKINQGEINHDKTVRADGNYLYNGSFQEGENRLDNWITEGDASFKVTGLSDGRRLEAGVAKSGASISQSALPLTAGKYALSLKLQGKSGNRIHINIAGKDFEYTLTDDNNTTVNEKLELTDSDLANDKDIKITFDNEGTYYVDDIRLVEDTLIKNGSFNAGTSGYEVYVDGSASADYVVDSQHEDNAFDMTIKNTSDQEWKIQLKQSDVALEKGKWYKLSFDIKSSIARSIQYSIQRNGALHNNDWTPYVQETKDLTAYGDDGTYTHISKVFQMKKDTDSQSIFNIALGGKNITNQHRVCIDNIVLEETEAPEIETPENGKEMLKNADFSAGTDNWDIYAISSPAAAKSTVADNAVTYRITNVGTADWNVQLKQGNLVLEKGAAYCLKFKALSTESRTIKSAFLNTAYYWYGGADIALTKGEAKDVSVEFTVDKDTASDITLVISMGKIEGKDTPASDITLSDFSLVKEK
jgi:beta-glucanase (GH16 family)